MAGSVNKVILIGNLGNDPEIRNLENGSKLARFSIATSESYTDKQTGQRRDITDWHNIVVWRGLADVAEKYLRKGAKIYVEGKLKTRSWQDESGQTKYATEVVGDNFTMLGGRNDMQQESNKSNPYPQEEKTSNTPLPNNMEISDQEDDDLPF